MTLLPLFLIVAFILRCIAAALQPEPEPVPIPVYVVERKRKEKR